MSLILERAPRIDYVGDIAWDMVAGSNPCGSLAMVLDLMLWHGKYWSFNNWHLMQQKRLLLPRGHVRRRAKVNANLVIDCLGVTLGFLCVTR